MTDPAAPDRSPVAASMRRPDCLPPAYLLGTNRSAGHLLYADDVDYTTWRPRGAGHSREAFAAPTVR